jgi:hypothetical protein
MYFSKFKKHSPGRTQFGRGFVINFKRVSTIFGIKKKRTTLGFYNFKSNSHYGRYKRYIFRLRALFFIITLEIRISNKTDENLFQNLLRKKKKFLH